MIPPRDSPFALVDNGLQGIAIDDVLIMAGSKDARIFSRRLGWRSSIRCLWISAPSSTPDRVSRRRQRPYVNRRRVSHLSPQAALALRRPFAPLAFEGSAQVPEKMV